MEARARLIPTYVPDNPRGVVIVLHGGASRRANMRVSPTQLSVLRMIPIARRVAHASDGRLAVFRLLNSVRGWDASHTPVDDAQWALAEIRDNYGLDVPVSLIGHSLGGRAAILATGAPSVRSVVALNPFLYVRDGLIDADGHDVIIVHGTRDRIAPPPRAEAAADLLRRRTRVAVVRVVGGKHAMLRRHEVFDELAASVAVATLTDEVPPTVAPVLDALHNGSVIQM